MGPLRGGGMRARAVMAVAFVLLAACRGDGEAVLSPTPSPSPNGTDTSSPSPTPTEPLAAAVVTFVASLEGTYEGTWQNTTFGSQGPASIIAEFDEDERTFTL